jgi:predicted ATPase
MSTPNWYVITGGPSTGKTTVIDLLAKAGYRTTIEEARHYIDIKGAQGESPEVARENNRLFQENILTLQINLENTLDPKEITFLDRALPDELAYYKYLGLTPDKRLTDALSKAHYKKVFVLDLLPLHHDYARVEDIPAQHAIQQMITEVYRDRPEPVVRVPVMPAEARVKFILDSL